MARAEVNFQKQRVRVSLHRAQFRNEFRAFPIRHLTIVHRNLHQHRRIILLRDVVVRRILLHVFIRRLVIRIAPLDVFTRRERQVASSIVFSTSTNGTCETTALKRSGRMFETAPTSKPPALPPWITSRSFEVYFWLISVSAQAMKSVNVFILFIILPACRHSSPNSPPPRMCPITKITPRSRRLRRARRESRRNRCAVRTISVKKQRRRAVELDSFSIDHRHRNLCSIGGSGKHSLGFVVCPCQTLRALQSVSATSTCPCSCRSRTPNSGVTSEL